MKNLVLDLFSKIKTKAVAKGLTDLEFYAIWVKENAISVARDRVKSIKTSSTVNFGVHGAIGRKTGSVDSLDLEVDVDKLLDKLVSVIKANPEDPFFQSFAKGYRRGFEAKRFDNKLVEMDVEQATEILMDAIATSRETALKHGAEAVTVTEGSMEVDVGGIYIANINGEEQYSEGTGVSITYEVKSKKGGEESSFYMMTRNRKLDLSEIEVEASRAGEYSVKFIKAKPVESGLYRVLLDHRITALFMSTALNPAFSAREVHENRSPLKGKIGSEIASNDINVIDDPTIDYGIGSRPFDDEGLATGRKTVVEKGVLKTYLYNYYYARKDGRESTGNAVRPSPGSLTSPQFTNLKLEALGRTMSFDDMLKSGRVLVIYGVIGYWMSNYVNGSTQATVSHGLLVENGELRQAVKNVVIGGNIYSWLKENLVAVSKDVVKTFNMYTPALLIDNVRVAG